MSICVNQIDEIQFPLLAASRAPVIAIGGVGGSGTRLLAAIMQSAGINMGGDLNVSLDNLWFTLLFKQAGITQLTAAAFQQRLRYFVAANIGGMPFDEQATRFIHQLAEQERPNHWREWLQERVDSLLLTSANQEISGPWGWKEPNTHICLERLMEQFPKLKYIHVARSGVDMAFSANQAQLEFWGELLLGKPLENNPHNSLRYWCVSHQRVFSLANAFSDRFMFLKFEDLCEDTDYHLERILEFVGIDVSCDQFAEMKNLVRPPDTIGRYKSRDLSQFSATDIAYVESLGFSCEAKIKCEAG